MPSQSVDFLHMTTSASGSGSGRQVSVKPTIEPQLVTVATDASLISPSSDACIHLSSHHVIFLHLGALSYHLLQSAHHCMCASVQGGTCNGKRRFVWARHSRCHPRRGRPGSLFKQMHAGLQMSLLQPQNSAESEPSLSAVQQSTRKHRRPVALPSLCGKKIDFIILVVFYRFYASERFLPVRK